MYPIHECLYHTPRHPALRVVDPEGRMWERLRLAINQPVFSPITEKVWRSVRVLSWVRAALAMSSSCTLRRSGLVKEEKEW